MVVIPSVESLIMRSGVRTWLSLLLLISAVERANAQQAQQPSNEITHSDTQTFVRQDNHWHGKGHAEIEIGDTKIYADDLEAWLGEGRVVATGNVSFVQSNNWVAADRADFNYKTRLGTFYNAYGIANIQPPRQTPTPGTVIAPRLAGQDTDVYFFGDEVEKIGPKRYKITNGGFSTCVQPTPRWNLSADSILLNIDHYTFLRQVILNVKGVPLFYLPALYYPTKEEQRATGFLLPTVGFGTLYGKSIHNAFFWAIDRSQDAMVTHDWFSKGAQGIGTQYRYNMGGGADGNFRAHFLDQQQITYELSDGSTSTQGAQRSYEIRGFANQPLPPHMRAGAQINYFSSLQTIQSFNTNVYDASQSQRSFAGNLNGNWRNYTLTALFDRNETFYDTTQSVTTGGAPRVTFNRIERPLFVGSTAYFGTTSEFVHFIRQRNVEDVTIDTGLTRLDVMPTIRYPFKKWQWLTVNSTASFRDTFYTRSVDPLAIDPITQRPLPIDAPLNRTYFQVQAALVGPVFNRIWDTPNNGYAERFKHTVEPFMTVTRVSPIDNFDQILQTDGTDSQRGDRTDLSYGLNNRFYAKRKTGSISQAQEIMSLSISQTYYTDALQSALDRQYSTTIGAVPSHFSPLLVSFRATPTRAFDATLRAEFDSRTHDLRTITITSNNNVRTRVSTQTSWTKQNDPNGIGSDFLTLSTNAHTLDNRYGAIYSFSYNIYNRSFVQQRLMGFYNAQCCGLAFDYSTYASAPTLPSNHKFFISFTLAGLGNFSPFNGALSGVPR